MVMEYLLVQSLTPEQIMNMSLQLQALLMAGVDGASNGKIVMVQNYTVSADAHALVASTQATQQMLYSRFYC